MTWPQVSQRVMRQRIHACFGTGDSPGTRSRSASAEPNPQIQSELDKLDDLYC